MRGLGIGAAQELLQEGVQFGLNLTRLGHFEKGLRFFEMVSSGQKIWVRPQVIPLLHTQTVQRHTPERRRLTNLTRLEVQPNE